MRIESYDLLETGTFWFAMADLVVFLPMKLIFRMLGLLDIIRYLDIMTPSRHNFYRVFERKRVKIYDYDPGSFRIKFRIHQRDARDVMTVLNLGTAPIILDNQSVFLPEEAFLIWLFRMTEATRLSTMEDLFGVEATQIGRCFNYMCRKIVRENHNLLFNNLPAAIARAAIYSKAIDEKLHSLYPLVPPPRFIIATHKTSFFIDGVRQQISRPDGNYGLQARCFNGPSQ